MFGVLPAYGMYIRHAAGITIKDLRLELEEPDYRPALIDDDVEGLEVTGLRAGLAGGEPLIRLRGTRRVLIQNCRPSAEVAAFVAIHDGKSSDIALAGNDLRKAHAAVVPGDGFSQKAVQAGNLRKETFEI